MPLYRFETPRLFGAVKRECKNRDPSCEPRIRVGTRDNRASRSLRRQSLTMRARLAVCASRLADRSSSLCSAERRFTSTSRSLQCPCAAATLPKTETACLVPCRRFETLRTCRLPLLAFETTDCCLAAIYLIRACSTRASADSYLRDHLHVMSRSSSSQPTCA